MDAGVGFPNDPLDPTNAIFTESPIQDILSREGLGLFAGFDAIKQNLETLQGAGGAPDLMQIGSAESPGLFQYLRICQKSRKFEITNKTLDILGSVKSDVQGIVKTEPARCRERCSSKVLFLSISEGQTLPVYVVGGQIVADFGDGALENR